MEGVGFQKAANVSLLTETKSETIGWVHLCKHGLILVI